MKVAVFGSVGFVGSAVASELLAAGHEVYGGVTEDTIVNLLDVSATKDYLASVQPDAVVNCAGIVRGEPADFEMNVQFTHNILEGIHEAGLSLRRFVVCGSAGEYGEVEALPVSEDVPLRATSAYASSKVKEEQEAIKLSSEYNIPTVVMRIFNPLGPNMNERFLIPSLIKQINEVKTGAKDQIEVSRLDAQRDYVDVRDIARAIRLIVEGDAGFNAYNVGSGAATSNGQLLELLLKDSKLEESPRIVETSDQPEPLFAVQADISRIQDEFGWQPERTVEEIIRETLDATKDR